MNIEKNINHDLLEKIEEISGKKLTLGSFLWSIRLCEEKTQKEFAALIGVSRQYLCDLEHGRRFASPSAVVQYANILGYSSVQFLRLCLQDMLDRLDASYRVELHKISSCGLQDGKEYHTD